MATPPASVRDYATLLARSKLLPPDDVEALYRKWRAEPEAREDRIEAFGKFLIGRRVLTPYQAAMIQRGRAEGFFLNGYKILDRIGKGQMGGVYKAVHTLGQLVALKILPASRSKDQHLLSRFQREAGLLTRLDHPNVVRAYQIGEAGSVHYIVMEHLEGETLDEVLGRRKRLPVGEATRLIHQALNGLQHLHERRLVHRDLKPSNLMLTPAGGEGGRPDTTWDATIKILDIGLGRELFDENTPEGQIDTQLTAEGAVLGTPDYLAPEQARDARSADIRSDIYSIGCVLYHAVTGRTPFPDTNIMTQMLKHATEKPAPVAHFVPDAPPGLQKLLDTFMAKDPDRRYQTPAAAAEALAAFLTPDTGAAPTGAKVVPAYQKWLETESHLEMPPELRDLELPGTAPAAVLPAMKPGTGANPVLPVGKSGTTPAAALPSPPRPAEKSTRPSRKSPPAEAVPPARPKPGTAASRPLPTPVPAPPYPTAPIEEVDVELVTDFPAAPDVFAPPAPAPAEAQPDRPLWELGRRDLFMLVSGGAGVLMAVGVGYGLSRLFRRKDDGKS